MDKILIAGVVAVFGFWGWWERKEYKKQDEQQKTWDEKHKAMNEEWKARDEAIRQDAIQAEADCIQLLSKIITSSNNVIKGYRILRHIRMVSITGEVYKSVAERKFLLAIEEAGGNGVINMQVRPHRGGYFSVQGDAVLIELA